VFFWQNQAFGNAKRLLPLRAQSNLTKCTKFYEKIIDANVNILFDFLTPEGCTGLCLMLA